MSELETARWRRAEVAKSIKSVAKSIKSLRLEITRSLNNSIMNGRRGRQGQHHGER